MIILNLKMQLAEQIKHECYNFEKEHDYTEYIWQINLKRRKMDIKLYTKEATHA